MIMDSTLEVVWKKESIISLLKMNVNEINRYFRKKREYRYYLNLPVKISKIPESINLMFRMSLKLDRLINRRKLEIIRDDREDNGRPKIYATTHVGQNDVVSGWEAFGEQAFFVMGDPGDAYRSVEGFLIYLGGVIHTDTGWYTDDEGMVKFDADCKLDRKICLHNCTEYLKHNKNIYIFPEGAWNITPNKVVQRLYKGTVKMAMEAGADIIPVAVERIDKRHYSLSMGKNLFFEEKADINDANNQLREALSTLKWELIEKKGISKRKEMKEYNIAYREFVDDIMSETSRGYSEDIIRASRWNDAY